MATDIWANEPLTGTLLGPHGECVGQYVLFESFHNLQVEKERLRAAIRCLRDDADGLLEDLQMDDCHDEPWYEKAVDLVAAIDAALSSEPAVSK